ncbi:MAG TPA: hypothetical protein VLW65_04770 [Bryobacteraceae bacterium]|nr:hypothetical protein [Bryobacteraceae bacterium]
MAALADSAVALPRGAAWVVDSMAVEAASTVVAADSMAEAAVGSTAVVAVGSTAVAVVTGNLI